jgi:hypothetical protein
MIVTLQVQGYWGPLVFDHNEIDNAVALYVLRYLQAFGVADSWCADDVVEHVGGQGFALGCCLGQLKGKCALGPFLSILVIECQHKCLNVNLCP